MNQRLNQFTLKGGLANNSFGMNIELVHKTLIADTDQRYAVFFSRGLDAGRIDMTWNRLTLRLSHTMHMTYILRVKAANEKTFFYKDTFYNAEDFLQDPLLTPEDKFHFFAQENGGIQFTNCEDVLLYRLEGRYLWVCLEFYYEKGTAPMVEDMCVEFPMENFIQYLPEVYQENYDFTSRFLAIAGMEFTDINDKIDEFENHLDLNIMEEENLPYFSTWIGAEEKLTLLPKEKVRDFLKRSVEFSAIKGTPNCIKEVMEFLVEDTVTIVEYHNYQNKIQDEQKRRFLKQVLKDAYTFGVILKENCYEKGATKGQVTLFLQYYKPAFAKPVIIYEITDKQRKGETYFSLELGAGTMPQAYLSEEESGGIGTIVIQE